MVLDGIISLEIILILMELLVLGHMGLLVLIIVREYVSKSL